MLRVLTEKGCCLTGALKLLKKNKMCEKEHCCCKRECHLMPTNQAMYWGLELCHSQSSSGCMCLLSPPYSSPPHPPQPILCYLSFCQAVLAYEQFCPHFVILWWVTAPKWLSKGSSKGGRSVWVGWWHWGPHRCASATSTSSGVVQISQSKWTCPSFRALPVKAEAC